MSTFNFVLSIGAPGIDTVYLFDLRNLTKPSMNIALVDVAFINLNLLSTSIATNFGDKVDLAESTQDIGVIMIAAPAAVAYNQSNPSQRWFGLSFICSLR